MLLTYYTISPVILQQTYWLSVTPQHHAPLTVCIVIKVVYITSLSKQTTLNCFNLLLQLMLDSSNHSHTVYICLQQKHSTTLGIEIHLVQEHPSLSENCLIIVYIAFIIFTIVVDVRLGWFKPVRCNA